MIKSKKTELLELGIAWWWLLFIQTLTFDEGASWVYKFLTSRVMLEFGRISYALYGRRSSRCCGD